MKQEMMMFVCHRGTTMSGRPIGLCYGDTALPLAFSLHADNGGELHEAWERHGSAEDFFGELFTSFEAEPDESPSGLWVYLAAERVFRRPTADETAAICNGKTPWKVGVVL
jgi:hypothetical protein